MPSVIMNYFIYVQFSSTTFGFKERNHKEIKNSHRSIAENHIVTIFLNFMRSQDTTTAFFLLTPNTSVFIRMSLFSSITLPLIALKQWHVLICLLKYNFSIMSKAKKRRSLMQKCISSILREQTRYSFSKQETGESFENFKF